MHNIPDAAVQAAEEAVYARHERGFLMKPLVGAIDMRAALTAALPFLQGVKVDVADMGNPITLVYTNYRGETSERTITPINPWFGSTEWHPEPQWLLTAFDHEKQANRDFALKDFGYPASSPRAQALEEALKLTLSVVKLQNGNLYDDINQIIAKAETALSSQPVADGWLPIETAPKDGTEILISSSGIGNVVRIGFWDEARDGVWSVWPGRSIMKPTHWRPLPAAPGASDVRPTGGRDHGE